jgi:hypothetical protein
MKITKSQLKQIIKEEIEEAFRMYEEENNPWAICTASVGREDKEKYEKCVKKVKKQFANKE